MKIAFFNAIDKASGAEQLTRKTIEGLLDRGHEARLYVRHLKEPKSYTHKIPYFPGELKVEGAFRKLTGLNDVLFPSTFRLDRDPWLESADLWHFHNVHGHFMSIPGLSKWSLKRPIVLSPVDQFLTTGYCPYTLDCERFKTGCGQCPQLDLPYPGISRDATSPLWKMKRKAISQGHFHFLLHTEYLLKHYSTNLGNLVMSNFNHLNYGVDVELNRPMDRTDCAKKLGINPPKKFVVGLFHSFVLDPRKGLLSLLQELQTLARRYPGQLEVLVVGRDSEKAKILATPDLSVSTIPFLNTETELAQALNLCDVLLYPTHAENLSLTCLSALSCGVPVISSNIGGQPEAIRNGENGFLVPSENLGAILNAIEELFKNPTLHTRFKEGARQTAVTKYDMKRYIDRLTHYYDRILSEKSSLHVS